MRPPVIVNLHLCFLQMCAAYRQGNTIFQDCHAILNLHNMYHIYNAAPININKFFRIQFRINLLQTLANFGDSANGSDTGILPISFNIVYFLTGNLFQTAFRLNRLEFTLFQVK